jgi:hypothetical protein
MIRGVVLLGFVMACTDFADLARGVCGNGLLESGEDCDSDDASCVRCAVTCKGAVDCPTVAYSCGVDGLCHAPGGQLADPSAPVTFGADDLRITDVDRDGTGDVVGVSKTSIVVHHGDAHGALSTVTSFVTPAQSGPPAFGDLDGDGSIDVTLSTLDGIVSYTSRFGTLSPVDIESPIFGADGTPLDLVMLFPIGTFQLGAFVDDGGVMVLVVVDFLDPNASHVTVPCSARLGAITHAQFAQASVDLYRANAVNAATADFVVSFTTTSGALCATSIHGGTLGGFTFADITPAGAAALAERPVLADLDADADPCPSLVSSDGGPAALRRWEGHLANGHCTFDAAGAGGLALPAVPNAPSSAVAVGRVPIVPAIAGVASDALVLSSGIYGYVPGPDAFGEIYSSSSRRIARVATGDLDGDGDLDCVLATDHEDDLDVLYRFPLGLELLRIDTASEVTSLTIGDFDGNAVNDIAYTETSTGHQNMMIAYGTADRPLAPVQVATFTSVGSVSTIGFPDSVDRLSIADDLAVVQSRQDGQGALPTMTLLHGSPQRTMLSFFEPRDDAALDATTLRGAVVGQFTGSALPDLLAIASPQRGTTGGMRAWLVAGTETGLAAAPSAGVAATGLADCDGTGVCVQDALYLSWPGDARELVIAVDREPAPHASLLDPAPAAGPSPTSLEATAIPALLAGVPAGAIAHALYASDLDGDGAPELVASFATRGDPVAGTVRVCAMAAGVPQHCDELTPVIAAIAPGVTACTDAAPGHLTYRDPGTLGTGADDLVVLCHEGASVTSLYRVTRAGAGYTATPLAQGVGLRGIRVADVTGDGVDDVIAVAGSGGGQSIMVFAQCSSRDLETCAQSAAAPGGGP